jgi:hypothetical protein
MLVRRKFVSWKGDREDVLFVTYQLVFRDDMLENIYNEYGYSVEKNSEVWEFFNAKYKKS